MKKIHLITFLAAALVIVSAFAPPSLLAQDPSSTENAKEADLAMKLSNPLAGLISLPLQNNWDFDIGSYQAARYVLNVQPVIPVSMNDEWNLITRTIVPFTSVKSTPGGGSATSGIGDILQSLFFSPQKPTSGGVIWGAGPVILYPTASDVALGGGKWGAGPTALVLRQESGWTYGALANHVWSFAGQSNKPAISSTFLQPFLSYTTGTFTTLGLNTESSHDWINSQWTVPLNLTIAQLLKFRSQPVQFTLGWRYYAEKPVGGPNWGLRFVVTLVFPQ